MTSKPIIHDLDHLSERYGRYRRALHREIPLLEERLASGAMARVTGFCALAKRYDAVFFDAFGVLNVGKQAIPGAVASVNAVRDQGTIVRVVSNNASQSPATIGKKLRAMGFDFAQEEIISSGLTVAPFVRASLLHDQPYYLVGTPESESAYAPNPERLLVNGPRWREAEYILLCSNRDYYGTKQERQVEALLAERKLPLLVANPDLAAPEEDGGVYAVAGYTATDLESRFHLPSIGLGKPFPPIFHLVMATVPHLPPQRILMVGDTLDTDILGGASMGMATCLTLSGIYANRAEPIEALCGRRFIRPDYIIGSIGD